MIKKGKAVVADAEPDRRKMDKFQLNTKGCCFVCLQQVIGRTRQVQEGSFSLAFLTRHLKLDLVKVLRRRTTGVVQGQGSSSQGRIPEEVIPSLEKSDVRVTLCERCVGTATKFSGLFQQLEILRMEMGHCLELLRKWMGEADGDAPKMGQFHGLMASDIHSLLYLGIVDEMRKEFALKCSAAVTNAPPKVRIERLGKGKDKPQPGKEISTMNLSKQGKDISIMHPKPAIVKRAIISRKKRRKKKVVRFIEPELELQNDTGDDNAGQDQDREESCMESVPSPSPATPDDSESDDMPDPLPPIILLESELPSSPTPTPAGPIPTKAPPPECEVIDLEPASEPEIEPDFTFKCAICQQGFPSVDNVTEHFAAVHLPSIRVRLKEEAQSIIQSEARARSIFESDSDNDLSNNGKEQEQELQDILTPDPPITPQSENCLETPQNVDSHEKMITNSTAPSPCKITQAFPIRDGQKPVEGPVKVIYVGERPLIVPVPGTSLSAKKVNANPRNATTTSVSPSNAHICTKCGKTFWRGGDLYIHSKKCLKTIPGIPRQTKKRKTLVNVTTLNSVISEVATNAQSSINSLLGSGPSYEQMDTIEPDAEVESVETAGAKMNMINSTLDESQNHQVSRVDPLPNISVMDISNIFRQNPQLVLPTTTTNQVYRYNSTLPPGISIISYPNPTTSASPSTSTSGPFYGLPPTLEGSVSIHSGTGYHECRMCNQVFLDLNSFQHHYNQVHQIHQFDCNLCGSSFGSDNDLRQHWETVHVQNSANLPIFASLAEAVELISQPMLYSQREVSNYHVAPTSSASMVPVSIVLPYERKPDSSTSNESNGI